MPQGCDYINIYIFFNQDWRQAPVRTPNFDFDFDFEKRSTYKHYYNLKF